MFSALRAAGNRHIIDRGRVSCPLQERDADVEVCLQCRWAREVDPESKRPFVRCEPPRKLLLVP